MLLKAVLNYFKRSPDWKSTQKYLEASKEMSLQLDVTYIMRKLLFLDAAISAIMEKHEVDALYMRKKPTLETAK
jgi:hypothetical protein